MKENLLAAGLKWSNPAGHLVKVVILPTEVKYDDRENAAEIHSAGESGIGDGDQFAQSAEGAAASL